jgi:hypothetical protein
LKGEHITKETTLTPFQAEAIRILGNSGVDVPQRVFKWAGTCLVEYGKLGDSFLDQMNDMSLFLKSLTSISNRADIIPLIKSHFLTQEVLKKQELLTEIIDQLHNTTGVISTSSSVRSQFILRKVLSIIHETKGDDVQVAEVIKTLHRRCLIAAKVLKNALDRLESQQPPPPPEPESESRPQTEQESTSSQKSEGEGSECSAENQE